MLVFQRILNFRDVGKAVNVLEGEKRMTEGHLYRSARLDDATQKDRLKLVEDYKIKSVIDLRTKSEHVKQARKRKLDGQNAALLKTNDAVALPLEIPGIKYWNININGGAFEMALLRRLSWWSFIKLVVLMAFGYRMEAISILGREVMQPRGLAGLGYDCIDYSGAEIAQIFNVLADPSNHPVLIHCTQGKDRTGLAVALVLFLLQVPEDVVTEDYVKSTEELQPERESRLQEINEVGLSEDFADTPVAWIRQMKAHIDDVYGGIESYLLGIGVSKDVLEKVTDSLS